MDFENETTQYLTHLLGKFSGDELSQIESRAAFRLLRTLPDSACIKDFIKAAGKEEVDRVGLPSSIADELAPLVARLESNVPYAGRFASLYESGSIVGRSVGNVAFDVESPPMNASDYSLDPEFLDFYYYRVLVEVLDTDALRAAALSNPRGLKADRHGIMTEMEAWIEAAITPANVPGCEILASNAHAIAADSYNYQLDLRVTDRRALRAAASAHSDYCGQPLDDGAGRVNTEACLAVLLFRPDVSGCVIKDQATCFDVGVACG